MYEHGMIAEHLYKKGIFSMHWPYPSRDISRTEYCENNLSDISGAWIPPLNPWIIWISYEIFGMTIYATIFLILLNIIFSVVGVFMIYKLSELFFTQKIGLIAAVLAAIYLPNAHGCITYSGSQLYHLLTALSIYFSTRIFINKEAAFDNIYLGISLGLLSLVRSEYLAFGAIYILILLIRSYKNGKIKQILITAILFSAVVSPWIIRNTIIFGKFTTIVSHPWHEIWRGNHPQASGGANISDDQINWLCEDVQAHVIDRLDSLELDQDFELKADAVFKDEAISSVKNDPGKSFTRAFKRLLYLWTFDPHTARGRDPKFLLFIALSIIPFLLSIFLLIKEKKIDKKYTFIFLHLIFYCAVIFIINFETRYQVYFHTFLHPIGAYAFSIFIKEKN